MPSFLYDRDGTSHSWDTLWQAIEQAATSFRPVLRTASLLELIAATVHALVSGESLLLLDGDLSDEEVERLLLPGEHINAVSSVREQVALPSNRESLSAALASQPPGKLTLLTSGTTGLPKRVTHSWATLARNVSTHERHSKDVWALAYNPSHMAGIQVLIQALANANPIINVFGLGPEAVCAALTKHQVSHISASPTFYRLLVSAKTALPNIRNATFGGERLSQDTEQALRQLLPNARFLNIYASTEIGTLLRADGDTFSIDPKLADKIRVVEQQLQVHRSLLGEVDNSAMLDGDWYNTGDIVEIVEASPLRVRFVSRDRDLVSVGSYSVNLMEVEDTLLMHPGIREARVSALPNSVLGNLIAAEIVLQDEPLDETQLRLWLAERLQNFKMPRQITTVETLPQTRTGKLQR